MRTISGPIRVFHVDDEPDFAEMTAVYLKREDDRFEVETETSVSEGVARLTDGTFDCVVSDYDMPDQNGIEFLKSVREECPDLPFILYTGKGSEAVASDAISAGVTDYLQKESGVSQYAVLANRIINAVANHRAQAELADREQRLNLFFEQSPLGVIEWDERFNCVRVNDAAEEILKYSPEDLVGHSWQKIVPESDKQTVETVVSDLLENRGGYRSLNENVRKDGERIVCEWHNHVVTSDEGDVVAIFSQFKNVTERTEREEAIKSLHSTTNALIEAETPEAIAEITTYAVRDILDMPANGVHLYDDAEGGLVPVAWTATTEEMVGELPTFAPGEGLAGTVFETGQPQIYDDISTVPERFNKDTRIRSQIIFPLDDHGVLVIGSPEPNAFDEVDASLAEIMATHTTTALTRIEHEQELKERNEQLERIIRVISHDLRNPLNVADGRLKLAREESDSRHPEKVAKAHDRMEMLIDDLLLLERDREEVSEPEPIDLADLVETCWSNVNTAESTLVTNTDRTIVANRSRLAQVVENLVRNAVEHGGEKLEITVGELDDGFYIADDGSGIAADEQKRIFESGYSTNTEGTGFGLAIVKEIVESYGWSISAAESETGGAWFAITGVEFAAE